MDLYMTKLDIEAREREIAELEKEGVLRTVIEKTEKDLERTKVRVEYFIEEIAKLLEKEVREERENKERGSESISISK